MGFNSAFKGLIEIVLLKIKRIYSVETQQ